VLLLTNSGYAMDSIWDNGSKLLIARSKSASESMNLECVSFV